MKIILRILMVVALIGAVSAAALMQNAIAAARAEREALLKQASAAPAAASNANESARVADGEAQTLREQNQELPELRNRVTQLRHQAEQLAALRHENDLLRAQQQAAVEGAAKSAQRVAGLITRSRLADAGRNTPEDAIKTIMWAICNGRLDVLKESFTPENFAKHFNGSPEEMIKDMTQAGNEFPGYRIVNQNPISADEVSMVLQIGDGDHNNQTMVLKRIGNDWIIKQ